MVRTPLTDALVHRDGDAARDAARLEALCAAIEGAAGPIARAVLVRETAETGAEAWLEQAHAALSSALIAPAALDDADVAATARAALAAHLGPAVPPPGDAEVTAHARQITRAVVSAWVSALDRALAARDALELSAGLLPVDHGGGAPAPEIDAALSAAVDPLGVRADEARALLRALGAALSAGASSELPLGLALDVAPGGQVAGRWVARRAARTEGDGASGMARSGERLRDGAPAVEDPAARSRAPRRR
jgi:hypothetical protein